MASVKAILAPPIFAEDEEKTRKAALLNTILLASLSLATLYLIIVPLFLPQETLIWTLVRYPPLILSWILLRRGLVRPACILLVAGIWAAQVFAWAGTGGPYRPSVAAMVVLVMLAGLLLGTRAAFLFVVLIVASSATIIYAQSRDVLPPQSTTYTSAQLLTDQAVWGIMAAVFLNLAISSMNRALRRAHDELRERKRVEEQLRASEERFARAFNASPISMVISKDRRFLNVNDNFLALTGYTSQEIIGRTAAELAFFADPLDAERIDKMLDLRRAVQHQEVKLRVKSGEVRAILYSAEIIELGGQWCLLGAAIDITERKHLEEQLRQSQKLQAVGQLAGGMAHDFNNMLTVILGFCELLRRDIPAEQGTSRRQIDMIFDSATRASNLTQQMLAFSRQQVMQAQVLDVNKIIEGISELLKRLLGENNEVEIILDSAVKPVIADQGQLEQVIMNLAANARDAMPRGGKMTIEAALVYLDDAYAKQQIEVIPDWYVMMAVSDTGIGMDSETMSHMFEPFFTTKERGKGTGLGLATSHGVVKQSGGHITVYSELGRGTTIKVYLPLTTEVAAIQLFEPAPPPTHRGAETILLVEDELAIRQVAREILQSHGYVVLEANAEQAIEIVEQYDKDIHLLLTDVVMPKINGRELSQRLMARRPSLKVVYMSGYTDDIIAHHGILEPDVVFLQKPFTSRSLTDKVRAALDA